MRQKSGYDVIWATVIPMSEIQGLDKKLGQFLGKLFGQQLITEMFFDTHWKAVYLWC
jgi:hypothetical protein